MVRIKIGDIVEIRVRLGFAYAQYTHKHSQYGALLRVFDEIHLSKSSDFKKIARGAVRFSVFFPLQAAINKGIFSIVGNSCVRDELKEFPIFRAGMINPLSGKVDAWWLWDGEKEERIGVLTEDQKKYPIRGVWNDTLLVERIENGWTAQTDPTTLS